MTQLGRVATWEVFPEHDGWGWVARTRTGRQTGWERSKPVAEAAARAALVNLRLTTWDENVDRDISFDHEHFRNYL